MVSIASIAARALDAVALKVDDAILSGTLYEDVKGAYSTSTGSYPLTATARGTVRVVVDTVKPIGDVFPDYVAGPGDMLVFIEGVATMPKEGWRITIDGVSRTFMTVQDILLAGSLAYAVIR